MPKLQLLRRVVLFSLVVLSASALASMCPLSESINSSPTASLVGKKIVIDPGHGGEFWDKFRVGPTGEREEWINLRVANILKKKLEDAGAIVFTTRNEDKYVSLEERAQLAIDQNADVLVSIHHNKTSYDNQTDVPAVFVRSTISGTDQNAVLARAMLKAFEIERDKKGILLSDHMIFSTGLGLLRLLEGQVPSIIGEYSFFSNPLEEMRLKDEDYCTRQAQAYTNGIAAFFANNGPKASATAHGLKFYHPKLRARIQKSAQDMHKTHKCLSWMGRFARGEQLWRQGKFTEASTFFEASLDWSYSPVTRIALSYLRQYYSHTGQSTLAAAVSEVIRKGSSAYQNARRIPTK